MKNEILRNLENLLDESFSYARESTVEKIIDQYINETNEHYLSIGISNYLDDEEPIELNKLKSNLELIKSYRNALKLNFDEQDIIQKFKIDLQKAFSEIKLKIRSQEKNVKNQVVFLEYDFLPSASIIGYGKGDYPVLTEPQYIEFNNVEEVYLSIDKIDYCHAWKDLISLNNLLEEFDLEDYFFESDMYQALRHSVNYKTYILLHKAFDELGIRIFEGIDIERPLMIYGNEHDSKPINIYAFE